MIEPAHRAVADLADFSLDHFTFEGQVRRHLWHQVLYQKKGWAMVFVAYQDWGLIGWNGGWKPPSYKVVRMRRINHRWRPTSTLNLQDYHLRALRDACDRAMQGEQP